MNKMPRSMRSDAADFEHRCARMADGRHATALVEKLAELDRAFALRRVREDTDLTAREFPEFFVFAADRVAEAIELVRTAFFGMKVRALNVNANKVRRQLARSVLVAQQLERGAHLLVRFRHYRRQHRGNALLAM